MIKLRWSEVHSSSVKSTVAAVSRGDETRRPCTEAYPSETSTLKTPQCGPSVIVLGTEQLLLTAYFLPVCIEVLYSSIVSCVLSIENVRS